MVQNSYLESLQTTHTMRVLSHRKFFQYVVYAWSKETVFKKAVRLLRVKQNTSRQHTKWEEEVGKIMSRKTWLDHSVSPFRFWKKRRSVFWFFLFFSHTQENRTTKKRTTASDTQSNCQTFHYPLLFTFCTLFVLIEKFAQHLNASGVCRSAFSSLVSRYVKIRCSFVLYP